VDATRAARLAREAEMKKQVSAQVRSLQEKGDLLCSVSASYNRAFVLVTTRGQLDRILFGIWLFDLSAMKFAVSLPRYYVLFPLNLLWLVKRYTLIAPCSPHHWVTPCTLMLWGFPIILYSFSLSFDFLTALLLTPLMSSPCVLTNTCGYILTLVLLLTGGKQC
jgi:hypothetical protein